MDNLKVLLTALAEKQQECDSLKLEVIKLRKEISEKEEFALALNLKMNNVSVESERLKDELNKHRKNGFEVVKKADTELKNEWMKNVEYVKRFREEKGLSQDQLARLCKVDTGHGSIKRPGIYVSFLENNNVDTRGKRIAAKAIIEFVSQKSDNSRNALNEWLSTPFHKRK